MDYSQIMQYVGSLGIGAVIGVLLKHYLDKNQRNNELLFNARKSAYKNVIGRLNNYFMEEDTRGLREPELEAFINSFFSEVHLLCSLKLKKVITSYSEKLIEFHKELTKSILAERDGDSQDSTKVQMEKLHKELSDLGNEAVDLMRRELGVVDK